MAASNGKKGSGGNGKSSRNSSYGKSAGHTNKGRSSSGNRKKGQERKPDYLTIFVVLVALILLLILAVCFLKDRKKGNETGTGAKATPSLTGTIDKAPTKVPTKPPATKAPEKEPSKAPTEVPTVLDAAVSVEEARKELSKKIELKEFSIELLDDHLYIDGDEYYSFCINDVFGKSYEPLLLVNKETGEISCYSDGGVSVFTKFPLDKTEEKTENPGTADSSWAEEQLKVCGAERLSLSHDISEYVFKADEWTSMIQGKECFGVDCFLLDNGTERYCGTYYVETGNGFIYSINDETGECIQR